MSFTPYNYFAEAWSVLRPGHYIKVGGRFYVVAYPRGPFRKSFVVQANAGIAQKAVLGLTASGSVNSSGTQYTLAGFAGDITSRQVVLHLRYFALSNQTPIVRLTWMDLTSLLSEIVDEPLDSIKASPSAPFPINLWSFDQSQTLIVTLDNSVSGSNLGILGSQNVYLDVVEYKLSPTKRTPRQYILLTERGFATAPIASQNRPPEIPHISAHRSTVSPPVGEVSVIAKGQYAVDQYGRRVRVVRRA